MDILFKDEIQTMRKACQLAARTLDYVAQYIKPGVTTLELDQIVYDYTLSHNAVPAPLNYRGYPKSICASKNHVICHGVPDTHPLEEGDIINIDITTIKDGFYGDTSKTFFVGEVSLDAKLLVDCAEVSMWKGIEAISPHAKTGDIGFAVNKYITKKGFYAVQEIGGHGIGKKFHTDPFVPSYGKKGKGERLLPGLCITVEPMVNETNSNSVEIDIPGSTVKIYETNDRCLSAQFEHTVLITDNGYEVLTLLD